MKKFSPIVIVAVIALLAHSACSKSSSNSNPTGNWTCTCTITSGGVKDTVSLPFTNVAKNTATSACTSAQSTYTTGGTTASCVLN